jgi:dTMP kinase
MLKSKGILITFEKTGDGLGGTTQSRHLYENLKRAGFNTVLTREPGGTEIGQILRGLLIDKTYKLAKPTELLLYVADRAQHYADVLEPALREGKIVVSDRFFDSTLVYQGYGRGWNTAVLEQLHQIATNNLLPDLTFVLDGQPHRAMNEADTFESLGQNFKARIRQGMLHTVNSAKLNYSGESRYILINANQPELVVADSIYNSVQKRLLAGRGTATNHCSSSFT